MANGTPLDRFDLCEGKNVAKPNWGKKLKCQSCDAAFYDMGNPTPACPKCETVYAPVVKGRRSAAAAPAAPAPKKAAVLTPEEGESEDILLDDDDDLDDVLEDDDEDDDSLIEDASDLAEDDDLGEIKDHATTDLSE